MIFNLDNLPDEYIDDPGFKSKLQTKMLSELAGSEKIYFHIDYIRPGGRSVKYHSHTRQEEFFFVLRGKGTLRINEINHEVKQGDFFAKPAGQNLSHQFINSGTEILEILDCGLKDKNDVIYYPDEDVYYEKGKNKVFKNGKELENWSSDPDNE